MSLTSSRHSRAWLRAPSTDRKRRYKGTPLHKGVPLRRRGIEVADAFMVYRPPHIAESTIRGSKETLRHRRSSLQMEKVQRAIKDKPRAARAAAMLAHPIRVRALTILVDRIASPAEIAKEIGETVQLVNNHVKVLRDGDAVELMKTVKKGGADEHYYRATRRPELNHEEWLELSDAHKEELLLVGIRNFFAESLASIEANKMVADPYIYWWWKAVRLDEQGQEEKKKEQDSHVARLLEIEAQSNARVVQAGGEFETSPAVLGVMGFHRARPAAVNEFMN